LLLYLVVISGGGPRYGVERGHDRPPSGALGRGSLDRGDRPAHGRFEERHHRQGASPVAAWPALADPAGPPAGAVAPPLGAAPDHRPDTAPARRSCYDRPDR